jgi:hypothetical protein
MDVKNQIEQGVEGASRGHLVRRLTKAAAHARELAALAAARCDARSSLEAEAYSAWMAGTLLLERESDWEGAAAAFRRAHDLLEGLLAAGGLEQRATCRHFLDQVEPAVRFCEYQLGRRRGGAPDAAAVLRAAPGPAADVLASKLAALAAEATAAQAAATSALEWGGETLPVRDERCRVALAAAQELEAGLGGAEGAEGAEPMDADAEGAGAGAADVEARVGLFDRTINAYSEARAAVRAAAQLGAQGADAEAQRAELASLGRALHAIELQHTIARNLFLADAAAARLARAQRRALVPGAAGRARDGKDGRPARPDDVARLFDTLAANATELNELAAEVGGAKGEALMDSCAARVAHFRAARCLYVAHVYLASGQAAQAAALFGRAAERAAQAAARYGECAAPDARGAAHVAAAAQQAAAFRAVAAAELRAGQLREAAAAAAGVDGLELGGAAAAPSAAAAAAVGGKRGRDEGGVLSESLGEWAAFAGADCPVPRICRIPPPPAMMPVRPIVLDTALMAIEPPSVAHRAPKRAAPAAGPAAAGMVGRLFGWGK